MTRRRVVVVGLGIAAVLSVVAATAWVMGRKAEPASLAPAETAAVAFADAWVADELADVPVTAASGKVADLSLVTTLGVGPSTGSAPTAARVTEVAEVANDDNAARRAEATLEVTWQLDDDRTWDYKTRLPLVEKADRWLVDWTPAVVHPRLAEGDILTTVRVEASRGEILGPDGKPLVSIRPVVEVGIQPGGTDDPAATAAEVARIVGVDEAALATRVEAAAATDTVSVVTLRSEAFEPLRSELEAIEGVTLRPDEIPLAPTRAFARALLPDLQEAQEAVLGGKPGLSIRADRSGSGQEPIVLADFPAEPGTSVTVTLDPAVQAAADAVMATAPNPAALVAIRVSTGDVLAVANGPAGADGYNRAMLGRYPPGSTFKVASAFGLLQAGLTPETVVPCPATIVVGKEFSNAEDEVLGDVAFRTDFADSCNTAFVGQSKNLSPEALADVAADLGFRPLDLGVPLVAGTVPVEGSETDHAANMIGQGKVEASPLVVALMSASVAAGRSLEPRLIVDPANPNPAPGPELPAGPIADLRGLMRAVVIEGTGSAVADVPGAEVAGKTGTAEYGTDVPPRTHAWFTGFQGDVAFAVLVEDGGFGGQVAAPLAAAFLRSIGG